MSTLTENVAKVKSAHAALSASIEAKGVTVPAGTKLTGMPALVDQIQTGGGGAVEPTNTRAVFAYDSSSSIVVPNTMVVDMTAMTELNSCFYECYNISSLTLPDGFGRNAGNVNGCFQRCLSMTSLTLPEGFGQNADDVGNCFDTCVKLQSLTLPEGFGQNASSVRQCFKGCKALTSLTLPDGFGQNAMQVDSCFSECEALTSLTLPGGFGQNAEYFAYFFYYCKSLTSLALPDGFGQNATDLDSCFMGCTNLTEITGNPNFKVSLVLDGSWGLTHDSLMVVINGLQTVTETQTLTLGSINLDKLTEEEKQVAIDKGWTLA